MGIPSLKEEHRCGLVIHTTQDPSGQSGDMLTEATIVPLTKYNVTTLNEEDSTLVPIRKTILPIYYADNDPNTEAGSYKFQDPFTVINNTAYMCSKKNDYPILSYFDIPSALNSVSPGSATLDLSNINVLYNSFNFKSGFILSNNTSFGKTAYALVSIAHPYDDYYWTYLTIWDIDNNGVPSLHQNPIAVDFTDELLWSGPPEDYAAYIASLDSPPLKEKVSHSWGYSPVNTTSVGGTFVDLIFCIGSKQMFHVLRSSTTGQITAINLISETDTVSCLSIAQLPPSKIDNSLLGDNIGTHLYHVIGTSGGMLLANYTVPSEEQSQNNTFTTIFSSVNSSLTWINEVTLIKPVESTASYYIVFTAGNGSYGGNSYYIECPLIVTPQIKSFVTPDGFNDQYTINTVTYVNKSAEEPFNGNPINFVAEAYYYDNNSYDPYSCLLSGFLIGHHTTSSELGVVIKPVCSYQNMS